MQSWGIPLKLNVSSSTENVITGGHYMDNLTIKTKDSRIAPIAQKCLPSITVSSLKDEERTRCSIWSRVMGYHRPVSYYNIGKKQEFADRLNFKEPKED